MMFTLKMTQDWKKRFLGQVLPKAKSSLEASAAHEK